MSVKDLIWVNVGQSLKSKRNMDLEVSRYQAEAKNFEAAYLVLLDLRSIEHNTNFYTRINAYKDTKQKKIESLSVKTFPSMIFEKERKIRERRAQMTPEEIEAEDLKDFMAGKIIRPE